MIPIPDLKKTTAIQKVQCLADESGDPETQREEKNTIFNTFVTYSNSTNNHVVTPDLIKRCYYLMWQQWHVQHASAIPQAKACMTKRIL